MAIFMQILISGETDRFNLSVLAPEDADESSLGEDISRWLAGALVDQRFRVNAPRKADPGWCFEAEDGDIFYRIIVSGVSDDEPTRPNFGQWFVHVERVRSLLDIIFGRNKTSPTDRICLEIASQMRTAGFQSVHGTVA